MDGGSKGTYVSLRIPLQEEIGGDVSLVQFDSIWAYAADITNDVIVGFPFLHRGNLAVDCSSLSLRCAPTSQSTTCHSIGPGAWGGKPVVARVREVEVRTGHPHRRTPKDDTYVVCERHVTQLDGKTGEDGKCPTILLCIQGVAGTPKALQRRQVQLVFVLPLRVTLLRLLVLYPVSR